jgi:gas vesicle protein
MDGFKMGDYRYSEKKQVPTAITFLLIGAAIGAVTALLMAPKSGKQMRKAVRRRYEDAREVMDEKMGDFGERAGDYWDKGSEWASNQKERVAPLAKKMSKWKD